LTACLIAKLNPSRCDIIETGFALLEMRNAPPQSVGFFAADGASLGTHCRHLPPFAGADFV
jgi:hypothetical protein